MKHIRRFLMAALLLMASSAWAYDFEVDGVYYRIINNSELYEVYVDRDSNNPYSGDVVIPASVTYEGIGYSVTRIGNNAFKGCTGLTSIEMPYSVTSIGPYAFTGCDGITSIVLPNSLTSIGSGAFSRCTGLTSIEIPNSVTSIGTSAFSECTRLTSIIIGNSVTSIGGSAFQGCTGLTSVNIPNSVTSIESSAFNRCTSLTSVEIPNSVTSIGYGAFSGCTGLTSIEIPNSVTSIGNIAFSECTSLTSVIIGNSVTSIGGGAFGNGAFYGCTGLTSIKVADDNPIYDSRENCNALIETETNTLLLGCCNSFVPNSVSCIGDYAFIRCDGLASIVLPNSVSCIGDYAFFACDGLTSVVLPNSLISIGERAFYSCENLRSINFPNSLISIGNSAFFSCTGMTSSLTIGNSVTNIGEEAFSNCKGLTSIVVLSGNPKYDSRNNCNAIIETETNALLFGCQTSTIPSSVTSVGDYAFYGSESLTSLTIPNSVTSIGNYAFFCTGLTSIDISRYVMSIGTAAFECPNITSIKVDPHNPVYDSRDNCNAIIKTDSIILIQGCKNTIIPSSVTSIGDFAFGKCYGLTSIDIPNSVTNIGEGAFFGCTSLTSIIIPNKVTIIGSYAFDNCTGLTTVEIPNLVERLELYAFYGCTNLTSVSIGRSVNYVYTPFYGCTSLRNMEMKAITPPNLESWGIYHYDDISLHVPCGCKEAYSEANYWRNFTNITDSVFPYDVHVQSSDEHLGLVRLVQQPNCDNNQAVVAADPIGDHPFLSWTVDGHVVSYANPYTFTVEDDIELVANFYGTGIDEETSQAASVSPNPAKDRVKVRCEEMRNVSMFSTDGRRVKTIKAMGANELEIDVSGMAKGIYMLRIETQNGKTINRKIIVQ